MVFKKLRNFVLKLSFIVALQGLLVNAALSQTKLPIHCEYFPDYALAAPTELKLSEAMFTSKPDFKTPQPLWVELKNQSNAIHCLSRYQLRLNNQTFTLQHSQLDAQAYHVFSFENHGLKVTLDHPLKIQLLSNDSVVDELIIQPSMIEKRKSIGLITQPQSSIEAGTHNTLPSSLYPTPGYANAPYTVFSDHQVFTVKFQLSQYAIKQMHRRPLEKRWYKGSMDFNGIHVDNVAIRTKGTSSLRDLAKIRSDHPSFGRFSFKVKFNKYEKKKFMGFKRLVFNNGYGDPTMMRDLLAYNIMSQAGVPSPRISFVDLWLGKKHLGIYQLIEPIDSEFIEQHFADKKKFKRNGNLYKAFSSLEWQSDQTLRDFTRGRPPQLELMNNKKSDHTNTELLPFLKSINKGEHSRIDTDLQTRYIAAMTLISNYDSYFANIGNYYLYEHLEAAGFTMLPWDFNLALGRSIKPGKPCEDANVKINHPTIPPLSERPMVARILEDNQLNTIYKKHLRRLLDGFFDPEHLIPFIKQKQTMLRPFIQNDPTFFYDHTQWEKSFNEIVTSPVDLFGKAGPLIPFIIARYNNVNAQLQGKISPGGIHKGPCSD